MKKTLIALSALGLAAAAHAQSYVSLFGTVDAAATRVTGSRTSSTMLTSGGNATSKLFFRGQEDLGGGAYAGFWLEAGLFADNGTGTATNTNNQPTGTAAAPAGTQGLVFNRRAMVVLGGPIGELQAGRNWTPSYDAFTGRFDVFGVGVGIGLNYTASINPNFIRTSNNVTYVTPKFFGGVTGAVAHWFGENASNVANHEDGTGDGARINYDAGPWNAVAHYARTRFLAGNAIERGAGLAYDGGGWRVSGNVNNDQQGARHQRGFNVGGILRFGPSEVKASYSVLRTQDVPDHPTGRKLALGYVYNFSKRTAFYTSVAQIRNKGGATLAIAGSTTAANQKSSGIDVGLRHNF